jgi:hypothetical protein
VSRTLFVGDVHGCAAELSDLLRLAGATHVVLVGDLFTKGPDPVGVWRLIREHSLLAVLGNHDARLLGWMTDERPVDDHARDVVSALDRADIRWRDWLKRLPLYRRVGGYTVVHAALHPSGALEQTTRRMALTMRRWPQNAEAPPWHAVYSGDRRVVFGHDARGGCVRVERAGTPWLVGLDTGCVYGGRLTGWLLEEDRLLHVPAARVYRAIKRGPIV